MKRELSPVTWALLIVAVDVAAIAVLGVLMGLGVVSASHGLPLLTAIIAGGRAPAAVQLVRRGGKVSPTNGNGDSSSGPAITGAVMALIVGAGALVARKGNSS